MAQYQFYVTGYIPYTIVAKSHKQAVKKMEDYIEENGSPVCDWEILEGETDGHPGETIE